MSSADRAVALDLNGDRKSDILWYRPGSGYVGVQRATGAGDGTVHYLPFSNPGSRHQGFANNGDDPSDTAIALDLNGDRFSDMFWYRPGGGYANAYLIDSGSRLHNFSYLVQLSNWMSDLGEEYLGKLRLRDMAIPGSHDAGTFDIPGGSAARNQSVNFYKQLSLGSRYFDFRVLHPGGEPVFFHGAAISTTTLRSAVADITKFLDEHPGEIIILDQQHTWMGSGVSRSTYLTTITNMMKDRLIGLAYVKSLGITNCRPNDNKSNISCLTMSDLRKLAANKKQILALYNYEFMPESDSGPNFNLIWDQSSNKVADYTDTGVASKHFTDLDAFSMARLNHKDGYESKLWVLYTQLTGGIPQTMAGAYNPEILKRLKGPYQNRLLNVVASDFVEHPDKGELARVTVKMNLEPSRQNRP